MGQMNPAGIGCNCEGIQVTLLCSVLYTNKTHPKMLKMIHMCISPIVCEHVINVVVVSPINMRIVSLATVVDYMLLTPWP